ncbi:omega-hydroxypalmitate O-feruloyl transferase [Trifolium repens]|nr:omega-hydroxypalmitate O-feruloyl transferase [Trifolium repens]
MTLKSSSSNEASKIPCPIPEGRSSSLTISGWGKLTRGGERAAKSCLSWQGITASRLLAANEARLSKNVLKLIKPIKGCMAGCDAN